MIRLARRQQEGHRHTGAGQCRQDERQQYVHGRPDRRWRPVCHGRGEPGTVLATQLRKINLFTATPVGDPAGSRTLMSRSLAAGLSLRHDEALSARAAGGRQLRHAVVPAAEGRGRVVSGPHGHQPRHREERLRVHPSGGVTVGTDHVNGPRRRVTRGRASTSRKASRC